MLKLIEGLFYLAALLAVVTVSVVIFNEDMRGPEFVRTAAVCTACAVGLFWFWRTMRHKLGRFGLLKYKSRKPLTKPQAEGLLADYLMMFHKLRVKTPGDKIGPVINKAVADLSRSFGKDPLSHDEMRSILKLYYFVEHWNPDRARPSVEELRDVRDVSVFWEVRKKVDALYLERAEAAAQSDTWETQQEAKAPAEDWLKNGWVAFLLTLRGPDTSLWHWVATDLHGISEDRLNGAFWIVQQEECDRVTVSDFIRGFVEYEFESYLGSGRTDLAERLGLVIAAYNAGVYKYHTVAVAGDVVAATFDEVAVAQELTRLEEKYGLDPLPRPIGLIKDGTEPADKNAPYVPSGFGYSDEEGLHYAYPGDGWRDAS